MKSKKILITGGSGGIGHALIEQLYVHNEIFICGRSLDKLQATHQKFPKIKFLQTDITCLTETENLVNFIKKEFGHLDILINNAGTANPVDLNGKIVFDEFKDIDINFKGTALITNAVTPLLTQSPKPTIVFMGSILGKFPNYRLPFYSASKAALHSYILSLRGILKNIKIIEVFPPLVDTQMTSKLDNNDKMNPNDLALIIIRGMSKGLNEIYPGKAKAANFIGKLSQNKILQTINKI